MARSPDGTGRLGESGMTTGGASQATLHGVTRALVALLAAEAFYRVAIRSRVRQAIGIESQPRARLGLMMGAIVSAGRGDRAATRRARVPAELLLKAS
jgi:hypothetical protein